MNTQNSPEWSGCKKKEVNPQRLLVQRAKFFAHIMVSRAFVSTAQDVSTSSPTRPRLTPTITSASSGEATQIPAACADASKRRGTARNAEDDLEQLATSFYPESHLGLPKKIEGMHQNGRWTL